MPHYVCAISFFDPFCYQYSVYNPRRFIHPCYQYSVNILISINLFTRLSVAPFGLSPSGNPSVSYHTLYRTPLNSSVFPHISPLKTSSDSPYSLSTPLPHSAIGSLLPSFYRSCKHPFVFESLWGSPRRRRGKLATPTRTYVRSCLIRRSTIRISLILRIVTHNI